MEEQTSFILDVMQTKGITIQFDLNNVHQDDKLL